MLFVSSAPLFDVPCSDSSRIGAVSQRGVCATTTYATTTTEPAGRYGGR
jgi:hypothetical protein